MILLKAGGLAVRNGVETVIRDRSAALAMPKPRSRSRRKQPDLKLWTKKWWYPQLSAQKRQIYLVELMDLTVFVT